MITEYFLDNYNANFGKKFTKFRLYLYYKTLKKPLSYKVCLWLSFGKNAMYNAILL